MTDIQQAKHDMLVNNCVLADARDFRDNYKTRRGYIRSAVKRLSFYEITEDEISAIVTW